MPSQTARRKKALVLFGALQKVYPEARCELNYSTPLDLAIAAILAAQCTDERVNTITADLFKKYRTASDWASIPIDVLEQEVFSTGFYRNKAKSIHKLTTTLEEDYGGRLPDTIDALVKLPGIGRKTANMIVGVAFGRAGLIVDTHFKRLANRLALSSEDHPDKIERDVAALFREQDWTTLSHTLTFHGRTCCHARKPDCANCPIRDDCGYYAQQATAHGG